MTSTAEETIARLKAEAEAESDDEVIDAEAVEVEEETPKKHGDSNREYVVLKTWTEAGRITASTSKAAVESLPAAGLKNGDKYVAVPVRNWNEHEVEIETKTTISVK